MKKPEAEHIDGDEMLDEYDFTNGVRGKYAQAMQAGYTITIHEPAKQQAPRKATARPSRRHP